MQDEHGRHLMTQFPDLQHPAASKKGGLGNEIGSQQSVALANARSAFKIG